MFLDINADANVAIALKLEMMSRSAFPVAIRQTLNAAAFDMKTKTLQESANRNFIKRSPNFFKTFSKVNKATGFNVKTMNSIVGLTAHGVQSAETAVKNMNQQEAGGKITKGIDYLKAARNGSNRRRVQKANYFKVNSFLTGPSIRRTKSSQYVAEAYMAMKTGSLIKYKARSGKEFFAKVVGISSSIKRRTLNIKTKLLYESRGTVKIKATHFVREAAVVTHNKMPEFFRIEAEKQFARYWK